MNIQVHRAERRDIEALRGLCRQERGFPKKFGRTIYVAFNHCF